MMSFLAAFLLVRYRVKEADHEEEVSESMMTNEPLANSPDTERSPNYKFESAQGPVNAPPRAGSGPPIPPSEKPQVVWSANPHLEQVGPFLKQPPMHLLRRCHIMGIVLTVLGFVLALTGTMCLTWYNQPLSVSVFATSCVGMCLICSIAIMM